MQAEFRSRTGQRDDSIDHRVSCEKHETSTESETVAGPLRRAHTPKKKMWLRWRSWHLARKASHEHII